MEFKFTLGSVVFVKNDESTKNDICSVFSMDIHRLLSTTQSVIVRVIDEKIVEVCLSLNGSKNHYCLDIKWLTFDFSNCAIDTLITNCIFNMIYVNDLENLKQIVTKYNVNLNNLKLHDLDVLQVSCKYNRLDIVKWLFDENKIDLNVQTLNENNTFIYASQNVELLEILVNYTNTVLCVICGLNNSISQFEPCKHKCSTICIVCCYNMKKCSICYCDNIQLQLLNTSDTFLPQSNNVASTCGYNYKQIISIDSNDVIKLTDGSRAKRVILIYKGFRYSLQRCTKKGICVYQCTTTRRNVGVRKTKCMSTISEKPLLDGSYKYYTTCLKHDHLELKKFKKIADKSTTFQKEP